MTLALFDEGSYFRIDDINSSRSIVNQASTGSDDVLSPIRRPAFIKTSAGLLSIGASATNFSET